MQQVLADAPFLFLSFFFCLPHLGRFALGSAFLGTFKAIKASMHRALTCLSPSRAPNSLIFTSKDAQARSPRIFQPVWFLPPSSFLSCSREAVERNITVFDETDFETYRRVKERIQGVVQAFFAPEPDIHLTSPTFFSRLTAKAAVTEHDEYWHPHVDRVRDGWAVFCISNEQLKKKKEKKKEKG